MASALLALPGSGTARQGGNTGSVYYEDYDFTALAVDADHALVFGMGWGDFPGIAEDYAQDECQSSGGTRCRLVFGGGVAGCVAYADDGDSAWGGGTGPTEETAIDNALQSCAERTTSDKTCVMRMTVCPS